MKKKYKCGSGWSEWVVPDRPFWMWYININSACKAHDIAYGVGGTEQDRLEADIQLHDDILDCYRRSWFYRFHTYRMRADKTADMYFYGARKFGADKFNYTEA